MAKVKCPICEQWFEREESPALPFCSERCRSIDLGRWLGERYSVPDKEKPPDGEDHGEDTA